MNVALLVYAEQLIKSRNTLQEYKTVAYQIKRFLN